MGTWRGRPQGRGQRWRGWYVGDDGKQRTHRFRTDVEAEAWLNAAADELGISKTGIRRLITSGGLKAYRIGRQGVRIDIDAPPLGGET
jgi:excisionase family DNA binding protein